jgi:hypothetical protein
VGERELFAVERVTGNIDDVGSLIAPQRDRGEQKPLVIEFRDKPPSGVATSGTAQPEVAAYVDTARSDADDAMAEISKALGSGANR